MSRPFAFVLPAVLVLVFGGAAFGRATPLYLHFLTPAVLTIIASACKLGALAGGALAAGQCAFSFSRVVPMRRSWRSVQAWFVLFFAGQVVLTTYELSRGSAPVPSVGDVFFALGYVAVTFALIRFIVDYRSTGFPLGRTRDLVTLALGALAAFGVVGVWVLGPAARAQVPLLTRLVNLGYPALDFVLLVPTIVLIRITVAFRGSRLGGVWVTLLVGIVCFTAGDLLFAIPGPIVDDAQSARQPRLRPRLRFLRGGRVQGARAARGLSPFRGVSWTL